MTRFTPNGNQDILQITGVWAGNGYNNLDNVASFGASGIGTSPRQSWLTCATASPSNSSAAPISGSEGYANIVGSRSRHPGGVNTSVRRWIGSLHEKLDQSADLGCVSGRSPVAK